MIQIISKAQNLGCLLDEYIKSSYIIDYRIFLRKNESLYANILYESSEKEEEIEKSIWDIAPMCQIEFLTNNDKEEDGFFKKMFSDKKGPKLILDNGRRRNNSVWNVRKNEDNPCPVFTFYSYKGGMGRTTTLAAFATYLSVIEKKKVVVIDCDIEAPGLTNFFLKSPDQIHQHNGFIEYVIDKETKLVTKEDIRNYVWEVDHSFTDEGTIYVMPSGNMDLGPVNDKTQQNHLDHYLEGISRIDLSNETYAIQLFKSVFNDLCDELKPDIILIDSKTGISDIMGLTVCSISDKVVGFFRGDVQSYSGLYLFLRSMINNEHVEPFIVNSILPTAMKGRRLFEQFKGEVSDIVQDISSSNEIDFQLFPISRVEELAFVGTQEEEVGILSDIVREGMNKDYSELFESLSKATRSNKPLSQQQKIRQLQESILMKNKRFLDNINLYADSVDIDKDLGQGIFYYRRCMGDLLNKDKFLIIGNKGTGKSYIYKALQSKAVVQRIKENTSKSGDYIFLYTIDRTRRILHTNRLNTDVDPASRYRYWIIYTWNAIATDLAELVPGFVQSNGLTRFVPDDTDRSREIVQSAIGDEHYVQAIESEFERLDEYLKQRNSPVYINIIYDQLDEIVDAQDWNKWIPDLIKFWRMSRFSRIAGKIFMRTDLFRSLEGINNINELSNNAIDIEWTKEEMFSYFFQLALANEAKEDFWSIMRLYEDMDSSAINNLRKDVEKAYTGLSPLSSHLLIPLTFAYFGEYVDAENSSRMGNSFDWFYRNLKNADDTISLRPFISLIKNAINKSLDMGKDTLPIKPILYQKCYTDRTVRTKAVMSHYEDMLADMIGSDAVKCTFNFISDTKDLRYKKITLKDDIFYEMLNKVIEINADKKGMENMTIEKLTQILVDNGIVADKNYGRYHVFVFSFLYKYNLGLKGS